MTEWVVGIALVSAIIGCLIGQRKGRGAFGLICGLLIGPLGILIVAAFPSTHPRCPYCKGEMVSGAQKCKNCGTQIPRCPACNKFLGLKRIETCGCGAKLTGNEWR